MVILVDHHFERHLELARIVERGLVVQRDAPRAVVDVLAGIKAALLGLAAQFVRRRQAGQTGAQHDDFLPLARASEHGRRRGPGGDPHAPGIHRTHQQRRTANGGGAVQELTSGQRRCQTFHFYLHLALLKDLATSDLSAIPVPSGWRDRQYETY